MQVRSWKAAFVFTFAASLAAGAAGVARAQEPAASDRPKVATEVREKAESKESEKRPASAQARAIELNLMIAGLGRDGCDVEVKPGTRSCRFQPQTQHVASHGKASLVFRDVEFRGADRNCSFAITVREAGQAPRTIYRGFRMSSRVDPARPAATPSFTCFMTSPSKLAGLARSDRTDRTRQ
jgi:hypothetical protein